MYINILIYIYMHARSLFMLQQILRCEHASLRALSVVDGISFFVMCSLINIIKMCCIFITMGSMHIIYCDVKDDAIFFFNIIFLWYI